MRKLMAHFLILPLATLLLASSSLLSQPSVRAELSQEEILIGDQLRYTLTVAFEEGTQIDTIDLSALEQQSGIEILGRSTSENLRSSGRSTLETVLTLTSFEPDSYQLPPVAVRYRLAGKEGVVWSDEPELLVKAYPVQTDSLRLMPIKGIAEEPLNFWDVLPYIGGLLLAIGILALVVYWLRRGKPKPKPEKPPRRLPLATYVKEQLDELERQQLWQKGETKAYQAALTRLLREYLQYRYGIRALEMTTDEIRSELERQAISRELGAQLHELLQTVDLVKFAKAEPPARFHQQAMDRVRQFVQQTEAPSLMLAIYESGRREVYHLPAAEPKSSQKT